MSGEPDFSLLFQQSSKDHFKGHEPILKDSTSWPEEWKTTYYKSYPRLPSIALSEVPPKKDFFELARARSSQRKFSRAPITKRDLSLLLKYSCGTTGMLHGGRSRRAQPSGGARFPLEVYPLVFHGEDIKPGVYHYNVKAHALDVLWERAFSSKDVERYFSSWAQQASVGFVITAVFSRNQVKYGERGYRYILIEAGHVGQNLYLVSGALGLMCCAVGSTGDTALEDLIDVDGVAESLVYALVVGK